jgi:hypothetical protein
MLNRHARKATLFRVSDSRKRNDSSTVYNTLFSFVLLQYCGFAYWLFASSLEKGSHNMRSRFDLHDTPYIPIAMDPGHTLIDWEVFMTQPSSTSWYQRRTAERLQQPLSLFLVCAYRSRVAIAIGKLNN